VTVKLREKDFEQASFWTGKA